MSIETGVLLVLQKQNHFFYFVGTEHTYLLAHADLHDGIADESLSEIMVFLLFEPFNVHPCTFHIIATKKTKLF